MIEYSAIAESSAVILTIYFLSPAIIAAGGNTLFPFTSFYRFYSLLNLLFFGLTIILAIINNPYSILFLIFSFIILGYSSNTMLRLLESTRNLQS